MGRGHAGRRHQEQVKRQLTDAVKHIPHPFQAADIGDFMQVGNDSRGAMRHHRLRILASIKHRAFQVDVAIDETWGKVPAGDI
ncbi:hypothetical protein ES703_61690 [subsurface metagenome]